MTNIIWHNGHFQETGVLLHPNDRALRGDGVFDTMLAVNGAPLHAPLHFSRVLHNAILLNIEPEPDPRTLEHIATELLTRNHQTSGRFAITTTITRGPAARGLKTPKSPDIQIIMQSAPVPEEFPPIHAIIAQSTRRNEGSPLSQVKSLNYGDNILAIMEAETYGANEAIMLNNAGHIACATTSNIVIIKDEKLITPPLTDGCQAGITRSLLMEKFDVTEKSLTSEDLKNSGGVYLINSLRGALPIQTIDGQELPKPSIKIDKDFHIK